MSNTPDQPTLAGYILWVFLVLALLWLANRWTGGDIDSRDPAKGSHIPAHVHGSLE